MPTGLIRERWEQPWRDRHTVYRDTLRRTLTSAGFSQAAHDPAVYEAPVGEHGDLYVAVNTSVNGNNDVSAAWHIGDRAVQRALAGAVAVVGPIADQRVLATGHLERPDADERAVAEERGWRVGQTTANAPTVAHDVAAAVVAFRDSMLRFDTRPVLADRLEELIAEDSQRMPHPAFSYSGPVFFALAGRREVADSVIAGRRNKLGAQGRATALEAYDRFVDWFDTFVELAVVRPVSRIEPTTERRAGI